MQLSVYSAFKNLTEEKRALLTDGELSMLLEYLYAWSEQGKKINTVAPRNSYIANVHGTCENTFYKRRHALEEKGFIKVETQGFDKKGKQKPAVIRFADWLINLEDL